MRGDATVSDARSKLSVRSSVDTQSPVMRCQGLSKHFGALRAVDDVSIDIPRSAVLGIGGPNGAGKTTLFDLLSGVQRPTKGEIWVNGENMTGKSADKFCNQGVSRTFQLDVAFDSMTAVENVRVASYFGSGKRKLPGLIFDLKSFTQALEALDRVGLRSSAHELMGNMPVLQRKLVMLAGALVTQPKMLLMDEPVGGLSPSEIEIFKEILLETRSADTTVVVIEHVMSFLFSVADEMAIMHQGHLIFSGTKHEMLRNDEVVNVYLGATAAGMLRSEYEETGY